MAGLMLSSLFRFAGGVMSAIRPLHKGANINVNRFKK
jgi:hypothetical protein